MSKGCLGKRQEQQAFFFSLTNSQDTHIGWLQRAWGQNGGFKGVVRGGIYRLEKLRALPTPLKSGGHPILLRHMSGTIYLLVQRVSRMYSY